MRRLSLLLLLNIAISINAAEVYIAVEEIWPRPIEMIDVLALESQQIIFIKDSLSFGIFGDGVYQDYYPLNFDAFKAIPKKDSVFIFWNSFFFTDSTEISWRKIYPELGEINNAIIEGSGLEYRQFFYDDSLGFFYGYNRDVYSLSFDRMVYSFDGIGIRKFERFSSDTIMAFLTGWTSSSGAFSSVLYYSIPLCKGEFIESKLVRMDSLYGYYVRGDDGSHHTEYISDCHYSSCNTSLFRYTDCLPLIQIHNVYYYYNAYWASGDWTEIRDRREYWALTLPGVNTYNLSSRRTTTPLLGNFLDGTSCGEFEAVIDTFITTIIPRMERVTNLPFIKIHRSIEMQPSASYTELNIPENKIVIDYNGDHYDEFVVYSRDTLQIYSFYPDFAIDQSIDKPIDLTLFSYPNPFNGIVQFNTHENVIEIYDVKGNLIKTIAPTVDYWKPAENVSSGVYIARTPQNGNQLNTTLLYVK